MRYQALQTRKASGSRNAKHGLAFFGQGAEVCGLGGVLLEVLVALVCMFDVATQTPNCGVCYDAGFKLLLSFHILFLQPWFLMRNTSPRSEEWLSGYEDEIMYGPRTG
jgi:hypothetical protein